MNRLQKKCFIVSIGIHLLLAVILVVGPAFLSDSSKTTTQPLTFIAATTVDAAVSGGGDNTVKTPPAELTQPPAPVTPPADVVPPAPVPPPVADRTPPPVVDKTPTPTPREIPKEVKPPKNDTPVVDSKPRTHKIEVSTKLVTSSSTDVKAAQDAARKAAAAEKRRADAALGRAIAGIKGGVSGSTEVKINPGPGGGGPTYANFYSEVQTVYYNAWNQPNDVPNVTVKVSVTIARDGTVISARIVAPSGNSTVDKSIQDTIDRVRFAAPLPENAKEDQREVTINFSTQSTTTG